jgi:hypothetical protein
MKALNAQKLIVNIKDGVAESAVLVYQVNDNGSISKGKSVGVTLPVESINTIIAGAKASAESSEGI